MTRLSSELALPASDDPCQRNASFLKLEARHTHSWPLVAGKINFICDMQAGKMLPLTRSGGTRDRSFVNDRFFLYNTGGYQSIGHSEPSLKGNSRDIEWSEDEKKDE